MKTKFLALALLVIIQTAHASNMQEVPHKVIICSYRVSVCVSQTKDGLTLHAGEARATAIAFDKHRLLSAGHLTLLNKMFPPDFDIGYTIQVFDDDGILKEEIPAKMTKSVLIKSGLDLCMIETEKELPNVTNIDWCNKINVGDWLYTVGAKQGWSPFNIAWGQLSSKKAEFFPDLWQTSVVTAGGNSGGPVYTAKNHKLIGIMTRGMDVSSFVPLAAIHKFICAKQEDLPVSDVTPADAGGLPMYLKKP
jgi:hypothetical protein